MAIESDDCVRIEDHTIIFIMKTDFNGSMKGKHKTCWQYSKMYLQNYCKRQTNYQRQNY